MPDYVLHRTHTHRSTHGHVINFTKGQPTYVPPACEREVLQLGAEPCEGEKIDLLEDLPEERKQIAPQDREIALMTAFELLEKRNQRGDFTGQGRPHPKALRELCGFDVENRERDAAWEKYIAAKAEQ